MKQAKNIAICGATGMVGQAFLDLLETKYFQDSQITLLASSKSAGKEILLRNKIHVVKDLKKFNFSNIDFALFSAGASVSEIYAPIAVSQGCVVIDNSSCFRYEEEIPLVVPEVNGEVLKNYSLPNIIANPNCSTIQMLVALKPIHDEFSIKRIDVTTLQAVSGTGKQAVDELNTQILSHKSNKVLDSTVYAKPIAFNALPHCDEYEGNRYTKEEMKLVRETHKILDKAIEVTATCVRVPVLNGHSESIHIQTNKTITETAIVECLQKSPGLVVKYGIGEEDYPTALTDADGSEEVFVGRIRKDLWSDTRINIWVVADNLLKGAALNSIQIAQILFK
jgi:aspartate-semialdehyde dehydrogenase|tara:strand:- start:1011 stop:2021 length:1011 start_codon:yes stop_codon:yes gene_type:complete